MSPIAEIISSISLPLASQGCIIFLNGELASGKTAFVQLFAETIGVNRRIQSPTFALMKSYTVETPVIPELKKIIHIDAYRLEPHHKEALQIEQFLKEVGTLVFIEWPTAIELDSSLPFANIDFEIVSESLRRIQIRYR